MRKAGSGQAEDDRMWNQRIGMMMCAVLFIVADTVGAVPWRSITLHSFRFISFHEEDEIAFNNNNEGKSDGLHG